MKNVLVISAHPDDEVLGAGGTIHRFGISNFLILDKGRKDPIDQKFETVPLVHWVSKIEKVINKLHPEVVFTHFAHDLNRDHQIIYEATLVACRPQSGVKEIYSYETFSSSHTYDFNPDTYIELSTEDINYKMDIMQSKYQKELQPYPHPRSLVGIHTLATYRGMQVHHNFAEAFVTVRRQI